MEKPYQTLQNLALHIEYLLQHHECVTLPGLGALLVHGIAPEYDRIGRCWRAPGRAVSFNADIVRTDGLLAGSIARRDGLSHESAARRVESVVAQMRATLSSGESVEIGRVGTLAPTDYGTLTFEPSALWSGHCAATMWLPEVPATPVAETAKTESAVIDEENSRWHRRAIFSAIGRAAACAALLVALAWVVVTNLRNGGNEEQYASVVPVKPAQLIERPGELDAPIVWVLRHHADASVAVEPKPAKITVTEERGYYLVVASLANLKEAEGFIANYPGEKFGILKADGRYRVFTNTGTTAAELYQLAASDSFSSRFPSSWVCRK